MTNSSDNNNSQSTPNQNRQVSNPKPTQDTTSLKPLESKLPEEAQRFRTMKSERNISTTKEIKIIKTSDED